MNSDKNDEFMFIKVRHTSRGETAARRVIVDKSIKLEELEHTIRERFDVGYDKEIEIFYLDEDKDRVIVSFEDELAFALSGNEIPVFEIVVKNRNVTSAYTYPQVPRGKPGDCVEVLIESQYLTIENAMRNDTRAWGTYVYTNDSDIVKILAHLEKVSLPETPPPYNLVVTLRFIPGNLKYIGTTSQGITTMNFGPYDSSFFIENVRTIPTVGKQIYYDV